MGKFILPILAMLASTPAFGEEEAAKAPAKGSAPAKDTKAPAKDAPAKEEPAKDEPTCPAGTTEKGNRCVETPTDGRN